jgi:hypothetical protein
VIMEGATENLLAGAVAPDTGIRNEEMP